MEFYLLNGDFENIGILDSVTEAQITRRFHTHGELTVKTARGRRLSPSAKYIYEAESGFCSVIEKISGKHGEGTVINGRGLTALLERQLIKTSLSYAGDIEGAVRSAVYTYAIQSGAVPNLVLGDTSGLPDVRGITTDKAPLSEWLYSVLKPCGASFDVTLDTADKRLRFNMICGVDRTADQKSTPPVIFFEDERTLMDGEYESDISGYANAAYVIGNDGTAVTAPSDAPQGIERREVLISARDIYRSSFESESEYLDALYRRGVAALAEYGERLSFSGTDCGEGELKLGRDYFLGDTVEVEMQGSGTFCKVRVTTETLTYKNGVKYTVAGFGDRELTLSEIIRREAGRYQ